MKFGKQYHMGLLAECYHSHPHHFSFLFLTVQFISNYVYNCTCSTDLQVKLLQNKSSTTKFESLLKKYCLTEFSRYILGSQHDNAQIMFFTQREVCLRAHRSNSKCSLYITIPLYYSLITVHLEIFSRNVHHVQ